MRPSSVWEYVGLFYFFQISKNVTFYVVLRWRVKSRKKLLTNDQDNDLSCGCCGYRKGWWFNACHRSLLKYNGGDAVRQPVVDDAINDVRFSACWWNSARRLPGATFSQQLSTTLLPRPAVSPQCTTSPSTHHRDYRHFGPRNDRALNFQLLKNTW